MAKVALLLESQDCCCCCCAGLGRTYFGGHGCGAPPSSVSSPWGFWFFIRCGFHPGRGGGGFTGAGFRVRWCDLDRPRSKNRDCVCFILRGGADAAKGGGNVVCFLFSAKGVSAEVLIFHVFFFLFCFFFGGHE
jgi:hypothetical protein